MVYRAISTVSTGEINIGREENAFQIQIHALDPWESLREQLFIKKKIIIMASTGEYYYY
jgi:hypothetical protein